MPYELNDLAAISGMPGLYRLLKAARHGVLVESLDDAKNRIMAPARNKMSRLGDISIYTTDYDTNVPLTDVFERIRQHYGTGLAVTNKSSEAELREFIGTVIPDYDQERVYLSDIKKLATWYGIVSQHLPYTEAEAAPAAEPSAGTEATSDNADATTTTPAPDEPLSTGGVIAPLDAAAGEMAAGNPEAAVPTPKKRKKAE